MTKPLNKRPRIFLGLLDICGFSGMVERGLLEIGIDAFFLDMGANAYGHTTSQKRYWITDFYKSSTLRFKQTRSLSRFNPARYFWTVIVLFATIATILWVGKRFDIIVLKSGMGFSTNQADLRFFRWLGRTLVFTFHGSDARPPYINGGYVDRPTQWLTDRTRQTKEHVDRVSKYATYIAYNPLSAHFLNGSVCTIQCLGHAIDTEKIKKAQLSACATNQHANDSIRILHAPSAPSIKGTKEIRHVIKKLQSEGHAIDYVEISGKPHATVLEKLARCDFVIDELYSDTHGAVFALEACAFGKPSVVCGYGAEELARFVPEEDVVPTYYCRPEAFEKAVRKLLLDQPFREEMGRRAREFFEKRATPRAVAERLLRLATGEAPANWFFDPKDIHYYQGFGFPKDGAKKAICRLVEHGGVEALQVSDKPELERRLITFSKS